MSRTIHKPKKNSNRPPLIFRASDKPNFPFDDDNEFDEDWYDDICPNCNEPLKEHSQRERLCCAYDRIRGIPS